MHTKDTMYVKRKIVEAVKEGGEPMPIVEIAKKVGISWSTAKTNLLELSQENKLKVKRYGKNWIIWKKEEKEENKKTCSTYRRF